MCPRCGSQAEPHEKLEHSLETSGGWTWTNSLKCPACNQVWREPVRMRSPHDREVGADSLCKTLGGEQLKALGAQISAVQGSLDRDFSKLDARLEEKKKDIQELRRRMENQDHGINSREFRLRDVEEKVARNELPADPRFHGLNERLQELEGKHLEIRVKELEIEQARAHNKRHVKADFVFQCKTHGRIVVRPEGGQGSWRLNRCPFCS